MLRTGIRCNSEGKRIEKHINRGDGKSFSGYCGKARCICFIGVSPDF